MVIHQNGYKYYLHQIVVALDYLQYSNHSTQMLHVYEHTFPGDKKTRTNDKMKNDKTATKHDFGIECWAYHSENNKSQHTQHMNKQSNLMTNNQP